MSEQDWTTVVLKPKKKYQPNLTIKDSRSTTNPINDKVITKPLFISNKSSTNTNTIKKVYNEGINDKNPDIIPVMIDSKLSKQIQQARNSKGLTQAQLANAIHIPLRIIVDYEKGNCVRNGVYVDKIKRYLGIDKNTV